jgi:hypothetical protein
MGRVEQKPAREDYRNLPTIAPASAIPNLHPNLSSFDWVSSHPRVLLSVHF